MDNGNERPAGGCACAGPEADIESLLAEARDMAEYARWALDALDLAPGDRDELWRHADAFRDLAEELRDIVRARHPGLGF